MIFVRIFVFPLYKYVEHLNIKIMTQIRFEKKSDGYRIATILSRKVNTVNLTKDEFISAIKADLKEANSAYKALLIPELVDWRTKWNEQYVERTTQVAKEYAVKMWKTKKRQEQYIEKEVANSITRTAKSLQGLYDEIERGLYDLFFDFKPEPGNSIPCVCILKENSDDLQLERCFEILSATEWWKKASGWVLKYECNKDSVRSGFRPWIELILDEETQKRRDAQQKSIDDAIMAFYSNKKPGEYCGD